MDARQLLDILKPEAPVVKPARIGRLVSIAADSSSVTVQFDGELTASPRLYPIISTYTPLVGRRVILMDVNGSYVVMGDVAY